MERVKGIEPSLFGWEPKVLPLNYTRSGRLDELPDLHRYRSIPIIDHLATSKTTSALAERCQWCSVLPNNLPALFGKLGYYHYTTPAQNHLRKTQSFPDEDSSTSPSGLRLLRTFLRRVARWRSLLVRLAATASARATTSPAPRQPGSIAGRLSGKELPI